MLILVFPSGIANVALCNCSIIVSVASEQPAVSKAARTPTLVSPHSQIYLFALLYWGCSCTKLVALAIHFVFPSYLLSVTSNFSRCCRMESTI
ncbi:hypothetical protein SISSUDRAFT_432509 [Sistotremastrum suecicum HHB10207 ss-3]|uniref:Uncharacterized protein n=1 Tax=Sistotremastrum suecicum HHB10207 ss-3 TaxID=1314776 RepID=A0A165YGG1_9AGAM|nr:hypothetical protein SISSUDRAFT_432509 [Sistotremastrum suecicum HHB10207 ss-3]